MKRPENDKWLDETLSETIGSKKAGTDFEAWKQRHPEAVEMLTSRARLKASTINRPHSIRIMIMKNPITKIAIAAVVMIACVIGLSLWKTTGSGIALADVLARIEQVKAVRYKWSTKVTGEDPNKPYSSEERGTNLISQEYGSKGKTESLDPNGGESTFEELYIFPDKKTMLRIWAKQKEYWRIEVNDVFIERMWRDNDPRTYLKKIVACKYESMGRATIDGIEVEGFRTTDPNWLDNSKEDIVAVDVKVWVDVKTRLPARYDSTYVYTDKSSVHEVTYDFQWDVPVDAAEFEPPVIPDDYTGTVIKLPAITEETVIQGLKLCVEWLGNYPESITETVLRSAFEKSETPAATRLKEEIKGLAEQEKYNRLFDAAKPILGLLRSYYVFQWDSKDPAYYGKTVTTKDADKVLMRWKVSDSEYRVIFGDLHAETVTPAKLAELEAALPK